MGSIDELVKELEDFAASTTIGTGALADGRADPALATTPQEQREAAQQVAEELIALQSIFGEDNVQLLQLRRRPTDAALTKSSSQRSSLHNANDATGAEEDETSWTPDVTIRLCIAFEIEANEEREEPPLVRLSATLPPCYPIGEHAPQLQLLNRYVGAHGVDHGLFGRILRVYMQGGATTAEDSVHPGLWQPGSVALFDGIERVREVVQSWHDERESERVARRLEDDAHKSQQDIISLRSPSQDENGHDIRASDSVATSSSKSMGQQIHSDLEIVSSPAITERKSIFVGHAAKINDPSQVRECFSSFKFLIGKSSSQQHFPDWLFRFHLSLHNFFKTVRLLVRHIRSFMHGSASPTEEPYTGTATTTVKQQQEGDWPTCLIYCTSRMSW